MNLLEMLKGKSLPTLNFGALIFNYVGNTLSTVCNGKSVLKGSPRCAFCV